MIKRGIVIGCVEDQRGFYEDMVKSLKTTYPIIFSWGGLDRPVESFEYGAIKVGKDNFDEFVFLHGTMIIKDNSIFDKLFAMEGTVALTNHFFHSMAKFVSKDMPPIPEVKTKREAIAHEIYWYNKPYRVFEPELSEVSEVFEERHGRTNMVLENQYFIKYKGHWGIS